jgi:hypothetical protein
MKDFNISRFLPFILQSEGKDRGRDHPSDAAGFSKYSDRLHEQTQQSISEQRRRDDRDDDNQQEDEYVFRQNLSLRPIHDEVSNQRAGSFPL